MFRKAKIRLALQYSVLLLLVLGLFSAGLYLWVDNLFDTTYTKEVEQRLGSNDDLAVTAQQHRTVVAAGEVAVEQFRVVLIASDVLLMLIIPVASYFIAGRSLKPLIQANESQKRFITNAAHELRTPLAVMSGEFELALKRERDNDYYKKTIISSKEELDRLTRMANQLLELQRIESQGASSLLKKQIATTDELLTSVIADNKKLAQSSGHKLEYIPGIGNHGILVNTELVRTAIDNLLFNALKYSKPGTPICIGTDEKNGAITIYIENMPSLPLSKYEREHVFERFFQPKDEQRKSGFGLGLAIVSAIMAAHDGTVEVIPHGDLLRFQLGFHLNK